MNLICQDSCLADPFFEHSVLPSGPPMEKTCAFPTSCPEKIRAPAVSRRYCVFLLPFLMERSETFLTNEYPKEYPGTNLVISSENFYEFSGLFHCSVIKVHMMPESAWTPLLSALWGISWKRSLVRQRILSYQNNPHLSTLFSKLFIIFFNLLYLYQICVFTSKVKLLYIVFI